MGRFANDSGSMRSDAQPPPSQFPNIKLPDPVDSKSSEEAAPSSPVEKPFPGAFLSTDDMYIMKASFLSKCHSVFCHPVGDVLGHKMRRRMEAVGCEDSVPDDFLGE